jgi:hypothetical protein
MRNCLILWEKAFDHVNWTKLMQNLKGTGIEGIKEDWLADCAWVRVLKYTGPR